MRKKFHRRGKDFSKDDAKKIIVASVIFTVCLVIFQANNFLKYCVFEWPIRWDVASCWKEQVEPSKEKAAEVASHFMP